MEAVQYEVVLGSIVQALQYKKYREVSCASLAVRSSTGKYFVQAVLNKVVLGSTSYKLCSTK